MLQRLGQDLTLIEARPKTGRFHQIRQHLAHAGYPIVGDYRYAGIERSETLGRALGTGTRMFLQAKELRFKHPLSGEQVAVVAPPDPLWLEIGITDV